MIELRQVSLSQGGKQLLEGADLQLVPGDKVGLIGANGAGKSSLFAVFRGGLQEEAGTCFVPPQWRISAVDQRLDPEVLTQSALDFVVSGDTEFWQVHTALEVAERSGDGAAMVALHEQLQDLDGYRKMDSARQVLAGLGFDAAAQDQRVGAFSGGWQMRLQLARALLRPCELLLLDEPTNHLDLDTIVWLERWLKAFTGTLIVIAHDSAFLDSVVRRIVWLHQKKLVTYKGNYTQFLKWRAESLILQQKQYENFQSKQAHLRSFINRFRAKASKAKQAQSRMKMLARMETVAAVQTEGSFQFMFDVDAGGCPDPVLQCHKATLGYGGTAILEGVHIHLGPADRIGLLGPNGAGKTTLMKTLAGLLPPLAGSVQRGMGLKVGYFAQHQTEALDPDQHALWHFAQQAPHLSQQKLRDGLGKFHFGGDLALAPVRTLSGGEQVRLVLCLLAFAKPHLLLLDEPTNHLDIEMREALTLALLNFEGAMVIVSHDRQLLETVVDRFWWVGSGRVQTHAGDMSAYMKGL